MRLTIAKKPVTISGTYLVKRAEKLAQSLGNLPMKYATKVEIIDGYIVRGVRSNMLGTAMVLDTEAYVVVCGNPYNGTSRAQTHHPLIRLPLGRDSFLKPLKQPPEQIVVQELLPSHMGTRGYRVMELGTFSQSVATGSLVRPSAFALPDYGIIHLENYLNMPQVFDVNPFAFVSRADTFFYDMPVLAPSFMRATYTANAETGTGWIESDGNYPGEDAPKTQPWSMRVSDSIMLDANNVMPFSKRVNPPPYDPTSPAATTFNNAQYPWSRGLTIGHGNDEDIGLFYRVLLVAHAVFDMVDDEDRYGARGLWIASLQIQQDGTALLVGSSVIDSRQEADQYRRPWKIINGDSERYMANSHFPSGLALLDTGDSVLFDSFSINQTDPPSDPNGGISTPYWSVDCAWVNQFGTIVRRETVAGPTKGTIDTFSGVPHDMQYIYGADSDGTNAVCVFFSSDFIHDPNGNIGPNVSIDIVVATKDGVSIPFSQMVPFRPCNWFRNSMYGNILHIGAGKFLFPVTSEFQENEDIGFIDGNMAMAMYDVNKNTLELAGVVEEELKNGVRDWYYTGLMDAPVKQVVDENTEEVLIDATVLFSIGGKAQFAGEPGPEHGFTYISYDSGATWDKIANYGSASGARYCGTMIAPRIKDIQGI